MIEKRSLLQLIRDKESGLNSMLDMALKEADLVVSDTHKEAEAMACKAENDGSSAAEDHLSSEREKLDSLISALKDDSRKKAKVIEERMGSRLPLAVDLIVKSVSLTG